MRYAGTTILGAVCFAASIAAAFYTTASDAMVSPKLMYGNWEQRILQGYVRSSYANPQFVQESCATPLRTLDSEFAGAGCLGVQYSGNCRLRAGFHLYRATFCRGHVS